MLGPRSVKVGIVDDSSLIRTVLKDSLQQHPKINVVAVGKSIMDAELMVKNKELDVLVLDVILPDGNGAEIAKKIQSKKKLPIILMSSLDKTELDEVINLAFQNSLIEFVSKSPEGKGFKNVIQEIRTKILAFAAFQSINRTKQLSRHIFSHEKSELKKIKGVIRPTNSLIVIGASTGGPKALYHILPQLERNIPPVIIVQHMPKGFTKSFAERLNEKTRVTVKEAEDGEIIRPGIVYIAPAGKHLVIEKASEYGLGNYKFALIDGPPRNFVKPSVDVTLESIYHNYNGNVLVAILTGMGKDGQEGCKLIKTKGGKIIAEDKSTAVIYGMPKAIIENNLADLVIPLHEIPKAINQLMRNNN